MKKVYIIPTGDEILNGIVLDLDSSAIMEMTVRAYPEAEVTRLCPVVDIEDNIASKIVEIAQFEPSLIVLIGGSGGGHRFSSTLGKDFTHTALEKKLEVFASREIYGKNGHMWSKLVCGKIRDILIVNVPGPYIEAIASFEAFLGAYAKNKSIDEINFAMAETVLKQYPAGEVEA